MQRALDAASERLAAELSQPANGSPAWSELEWRIARAAAALHGVTPLLSDTLKWSGPPDWQHFVAEQRRQTVLRHARIAALLEALDEAGRREHIALMPLKGAALHALDVYAAGTRPMREVDLLVRGADAQRLARLLESLGYREIGADWKHRVFAPIDGPLLACASHRLGALLDAPNDAPIEVELHTRIAEQLPATVVDITEQILPHDLREGSNGYPSIVALLIHLLLQVAGDIVWRELRLLQLHDVALLSARLTSADWESLLRLRVAGRAAWWAVPPLELVARYYRGTVPEDVLRALRPACGPVLRRLSRQLTLSRVSLTTLAIEPLAGLGWSGSLAESLRNIHERLWAGTRAPRRTHPSAHGVPGTR